MSQNIYHIHDAFFRKAMSDVRVAKDFFEEHLPKEILNKVDLTQLKFQKTSFIEEEFKQSSADIIYQVPISGETGYLYTLIEHQSTPDAMMPFRLLCYIISIMKNHLAQARSKQLPIVYAAVFYTGEEKYTYSMDIFDLFGEHKALAQATLLKPFQLIDVHQIQDTELKKHLWAGLFQFVYKYRRLSKIREKMKENVEKTLGQWLTEIEQNQGSDYSRDMIKYILNLLDEDNVKRFMQALTPHLSTNLEKETMTIAEQLKNEGLQQGIQQGIHQGMQQGMQKGMHQRACQIAKNLLQDGQSIEKVSKLTGLTQKEIHALLEVELDPEKQ